MPELPEVESYRRLLEARGLGREVAAVEADDRWFLKRGATAESVTAALVGRRLVAAVRRGKVLVATTDDAGALGLRFGMSGRLVVDGVASVDRLLYAPAADRPAYTRFALAFADGGRLEVRDPRRLGGVELDPDLGALGPDALAVTRAELATALARSAAPLKARLLDQSAVAGIGNLVGDELLWRSGLAPTRRAGGLFRDELARLAREVRATLRLLIRRGGSHTGDLGPARVPGGHCPRDGTPLRRATVGGRTTYWCPGHQR